MKAFIKDNRGVTLVELLIATIVLALITIPLLNSFKTSTRTAVKSEQLGKVSMAAQNILERIEAAEVSKLLDDTDNAKDALQAAAATHYKKDGATYVAVSAGAPDANCIWLQGISSGITSYNAMVEIEPYTEINNKELSVVSPMHFIWPQPSGDVDPDEIFKKAVGIKGDDTDTREIVGREIVLNVTKADAKVTTKITYKYEYTSKGEEEPAPTPTSDPSATPAPSVSPEPSESSEPAGYMPLAEGGGTGSTKTYEYTAENEIPDGETLSIYLLYTPMFGIRDKITVENPQNLDFDLFLVKKLRDPDSKYYNCTINNVTPVDIYTNINDNMGESNIIITYNLNGAISTAEPETGFNQSVVIKQTKDRAHKIKVKMYAADADFTAEPLTELKGITLN